MRVDGVDRKAAISFVVLLKIGDEFFVFMMLNRTNDFHEEFVQ